MLRPDDDGAGARGVDLGIEASLEFGASKWTGSDEELGDRQH